MASRAGRVRGRRRAPDPRAAARVAAVLPAVRPARPVPSPPPVPPALPVRPLLPASPVLPASVPPRTPLEPGWTPSTLPLAAGWTPGAAQAQPPADDPPTRWWAYDTGAGVPPEPVVAEPETAPTLVDRLRGSRLDPGRHGVVALVLVGLLAALLTGVVVLRGQPQSVEAPTVTAPGAVVGTKPPEAPGGVGEVGEVGEVVVSVGGRVRRPGVVRLPAGSRVDDAVQAAGGAVADSDLVLVNLARKLTDGEQVLIGVEAPPGAAPTPGDVAADGLVDLNTGTVEDFDTLPGIGPVLAQKIVDYRTESGGFASVDQLREVSGIGEARYAELEPKVRV